MKKLILFTGILFALQTALFAQVTTGDVVFNLELHSTLNLNVDGVVQEIDFTTAAQYNNGVIESAGIEPGFTDISVESTQNWNLVIQCLNFTGAGTIPINNLGVWCAQSGAHAFGTEVASTCTDAASTMGLNNADLPLISNLGGNAGDITDNAFRLHWEMGTMKTANPNPMNATSMFDQMANGDFPIGVYTSTATLTLSEAL
jgi:hypothetical protein